MAQAPRPDAPRRRELGIWPLVIGAVVVILLAVFFFSRGVEDPVPLPDSPAATGTAGEPAGTTGDSAQPGAPAAIEAPADIPPAAD